MSEPFAKLLSSITRSSIWAEDDGTRIVWITLLAMSDPRGYVGAAVTGIAHEARVTLEVAEAALAKFMSADPYSRNPDHDGRRIERVEGGWRLLNYAKTRNNLDADAVREYERDRKRKQREKTSPSVRDNPGQRRDPSASVSASASESSSATSEVSREEVAEVYQDVTGKTDLPTIGFNWSGRKADAGDLMRHWANTNGGLDALTGQLKGIRDADPDFMAKQPVHVWAERVGTVVEGAAPGEVIPPYLLPFKE